MVHPTYKEQEQIKNKIMEYLKSARRQSWSQLYQKAKKDGISKPTLSRYLKELELKKALVAREIDATYRPPRPFYSINMPPPPSMQDLAQWVSNKEVREQKEWDTKLRDMVYSRQISDVDKDLSRAKTRDEKSDMLLYYLYSNFHRAISLLAALHVWASKFPKEYSTTAIEYMDAVTQDLLTSHRISHIAPLLIKHSEIVQDTVEKLLRILFMSRGMTKHDIPTLRPYLEWKPIIPTMPPPHGQPNPKQRN